MVEQRRQRDELLAATPVHAVIHLLLVSGRAEMLVQCLAVPELAMADVTLPAATVESRVGGLIGGIGGTVPGELLLGDDAVQVPFGD